MYIYIYIHIIIYIYIYTVYIFIYSIYIYIYIHIFDELLGENAPNPAPSQEVVGSIAQDKFVSFYLLLYLSMSIQDQNHKKSALQQISLST